MILAYKKEQKERKSNAEQRRRERGAEGEGGSVADDVMDGASAAAMDEDEAAVNYIEVNEAAAVASIAQSAEVIAVQTEAVTEWIGSSQWRDSSSGVCALWSGQVFVAFIQTSWI